MPAAVETLVTRLKELESFQVKIGWFEGGPKYEDGTSPAYVASIQELGIGKIPPRSFMRSTAAEQRQKWIDFAGEQAKAILSGQQTASGAMDLMGELIQRDIYDKITKITDPPLSPITLELRAMKKKNPDLHVTGATVGQAAAKVKQPGYQTPNVSIKPLVDSGLMLSSLTYVVEQA